MSDGQRMIHPRHLSGAYRQASFPGLYQRRTQAADRRGVEKRPLKLRERAKRKAGVQRAGRSRGFVATNP